MQKHTWKKLKCGRTNSMNYIEKRNIISVIILIAPRLYLFRTIKPINGMFYIQKDENKRFLIF